MNNIEFSDDKSRLNLDLIIGYLHNESYWAKGRPVEKIEKSIENSLCIGAYRDGRQIGFARVVTDFATVYYLADIFIIPELQNKGIGHLLMKHLDSIDELRGLRGILTTQTAHSFYGKFGYSRENDIVQHRIMVR
ncbi:MAG: GNAT family N-acetyltransferase [Spirochaetales bacterium]|nr:GNAT family N-acetyltransferase [Spirochaetales bacterium]